MEQVKIRKPAVAGQFYPSSTVALRKQIVGFIDPKISKTDSLGCILPHAGYLYSGKVAVDTISSINLRDKVILIGPNHTGLGQDFSLMTSGTWETPFGKVEIDAKLAQSLLNKCRYLKEDTLAHLNEHSLEVELPLIQYFKDKFSFVPITVLGQDLKALKEIGIDIAGVIQKLKLKESLTLIASSDMTHYEPEKIAVEKDKIAIEAILNLDEDSLMQKIQRLHISMCGFAPVIILISYAKALGAQKAKLINYQTSANVTGDKTSVVGYAGIIIN